MCLLFFLLSCIGILKKVIILIRIGSVLEMEEKMLEMMEKMYVEFSKKFEKIDEKFEKMDERFEKIDKRFERMEQEFTNVRQEIRQESARLENVLGAKIDALQDGYTQNEARLTRVEDRLAEVEDVIQKFIVCFTGNYANKKAKTQSNLNIFHRKAVYCR